jgi:ankyrin repeat protein
MAELLFEFEADPNIESFSDGTPLHLAAGRGHAPLVTLLLEHGADANVHEKLASKNTPLHQAVMEGHVEVVRLLLEADACLECGNNLTLTSLHLAAEYGRPAIAAILLARGADPNHAKSDGITPLHLAVARGQLELVEMLLQADADPNAESLYQTTFRGTPLEVARRVGNGDIAKLLIEYGATE